MQNPNGSVQALSLDVLPIHLRGPITTGELVALDGFRIANQHIHLRQLNPARYMREVAAAHRNHGVYEEGGE